MGTPQNPISYLANLNTEKHIEDQIKTNIFIQKRNRMDDNGSNNDKIDLDACDQENKLGEINDTNSDINMKSPNSQKNKMYQMNQTNNHDQFVCKKMSIDLDDDVTNPNMGNKKGTGCNCKNSGCLKRYCECFSRMKYCEVNCQCKNCLNNIKYEKERNEAIRIYLIKSPVSFKKINMDLNNVTCNCKKSNCLKNYCECFQFGLKCTYSCGCVDCKNRNLFEKKLFFVENNCELKKNKNISNLRYKSYDFENTNHIALSDFIRIQNIISPVNTEKEERQAYEERLRLLSKNKSTKWNDSLEKKKKMEYEKAKCRFLEEEERRRKIDEQELKYFEARENMVIQKAKEQFFNEQDAVKSFNSKLLLCDMLKERDFQKEIKERKKERSDSSSAVAKTEASGSSPRETTSQ